MKSVFKVSVVALLMFVSFACKETDQQIVERQGKGTITTRYSADRTTATTYLTGTVTLAAGTYDIVDVAVGADVTLANGVNMNQLVSHIGTTMIRVLPGSSVNISQKTEIWGLVTLDNKGTINGGDVLVSGGTIANYGNHYSANVKIENSGEYKNVFNGYLQVSGTLWFYREAKLSLTGCSNVQTNHLQADGFIPYFGFEFVYGRGLLKANTASIVDTGFTSSSSIKFCCPSITTVGYGSTGSAVLSCATTC
ncbi:hypothetical protein SAMN05216327_101221 [Dyadobacter sp. SG02]|uniref:hypothetical protein n=1 Tax=Dyadobacter sp. SG02 TaxID=1855291 RepID=UPI0008C46CCB|nr:hypothetical protein [Dyadobacter sp. SG02]SEI39711.1 hypothetical protein SAMN05216327_101221 [Dyadobacter sp. SG02]